ncbi:MAG: arginine--tRNA ligase, partial [Sphingomonadales bacterium]
DLAGDIAESLRGHADIEKVNVAGPGFINLTIKDSFWQKVLPEILDAGLDYGRSEIGAGKKVNVEYVSANPTGPLHVGHVRGAVFGDALSNLLDFVGYAVTKEFYINDAGSQIDTLARSTYLRYKEALGHDIGKIPEGFYPGDYLIPIGKALAEKHGDALVDLPESDWIEDIKVFSSSSMMDMIRDDLKELGINQDVFFSEKELHNSDTIENTIKFLEGEGLIYEGVLDPPKGKLPDDWEPRPQTLFRATEFGDDVDRALKKSDGSFTYFAADIAYHYDKINRGFMKQIDVLGADHGGYVKRLTAATKALSRGKASLDVRLCQLVRLFRNGAPIKMSKRSGNFVTLSDLVKEVGRGVVRFIMLTRKNDAQLDFDFASVMEQSKDNPVFYVQYAHARVYSVFGKGVKAFEGIDVSENALKTLDFSSLNDESEIKLMKTMAEWPRLLETAALAHEPHRIAFYLYDLASEFHSLWNKGFTNKGLRFVIEGDKEQTKVRLGMIRAVANVIASGLNILGVEPLEEMR